MQRGGTAKRRVEPTLRGARGEAVRRSGTVKRARRYGAAQAPRARAAAVWPARAPPAASGAHRASAGSTHPARTRIATPDAAHLHRGLDV
ncbi:hypothetical protein AQ809_08270 [Burkholderia pseudomallei]|nr:hypothetical protein AQ809_08270 [Burkholderia pseudomallei]